MPRPLHPAAGRRAFTLVELLVVITIIAMLIALLTPAINAAREAGRRVTCINNQFQMAFATIRYNDTKSRLPGWRNAIAATSGTSFPSWPVEILPNMERNDIYRTWTSGANQAVYVSFFVCPSSPPDTMTAATLSYAGNAGMGSNSAAGKASGVFVDLTATGSMAASVTLDDVANNDGTANTLLLSEECGPRVTGTNLWSVQPSPQGNGVLNWNTASNAAPTFGIVSAAGPNKIINNATFSTGSSSAANMPSSNHPGGAVVAFCDGHTGFLKDTLRRDVYAQLLSWDHTTASGTTPYSAWAGSYLLAPADYE